MLRRLRGALHGLVATVVLAGVPGAAVRPAAAEVLRFRPDASHRATPKAVAKTKPVHRSRRHRGAATPVKRPVVKAKRIIKRPMP